MGIFGWFKRDDGSRLNVSRQMGMAQELEVYLREQIKELEQERIPVHFNEITAAYILNLLAISRKAAIAPEDACSATQNMFPNTEEYEMIINNAFQVLNGDIEARIKLAALADVARKEIFTGKYEFLIRHSKKGQKDIEAMFDLTPHRLDLRDVPPWSPKDLA